MVERMLEGVALRFDTDYLADREAWNALADRVIYTGPIDAYFGYRLGALAYRSVRFETEVLDLADYQGNAVVNYTDAETPYTRIIEHKHFEFGNQAKTVISREYSAEWTKGDEPYYPVNDAANTALYERYRELAAGEEKVVFGGRLGEYRYYDMDKVLEAALHKNPVFFWIGAGVALLTTFYMMRVIFVVFFGKSRSHSSEHATEVGGLMLVPLLILAVLALISGYGFMADRLVPFNGFVSESFHIGMPFYVSMGALVLGILLAAVFYAGSPASDKLSGNAVSRALANRLYIDWFYDKVLVRGIQGSLAAIIDFMDQFIISGLIVGGLARLTAAVGSLLRRLQSGSMAAYTALFGIGLLLVIYFTVFYSC